MDQIEILFTADRTALEAEFKTIINQLTTVINVANSQSIDWSRIMTKTLTPALVAGIASTFALAISQALQFQSAVQAASLNTTTAFGNTTNQMADGAYQISEATGQSANDVESAIGQVSMVYKNYGDALTVTNDLAQFATVEHLSMADAITQVLPLLQAWNVSAGNAGNIMATLGQSTSFGKLSIAQLVDMLTGAGPALSNLTTLPDAISQLQEASTVPGFSPSDIQNLFSVIVKGAQNVKSPVNAVFGDMGTALKTGGFGKAIDDITNKIKAWGPTAQTVATQFGVSANTITDSLKGPQNAFVDIDNKANLFLKNVQPLADWFAANQTLLDKFKEAWTTLVADLEVAVVPKFIQALLDTLNGADVLTKIFNEGSNGPTSTAVTAGLGQDIMQQAASNNPLAGFKIIADSFIDGINQLVGQFNKNGGVNNTNVKANVTVSGSGSSQQDNVGLTRSLSKISKAGI